MKQIKWIPKVILKVHIPVGDDEYKKPFSTTMRIARSFRRIPIPNLQESIGWWTDRSIVAGRPIPDIRSAMEQAPGGSMILISVIDGNNVPSEVSDKGGVMTIGTTIPSLSVLRRVHVGAQDGIYYMIGTD